MAFRQNLSGATGTTLTGAHGGTQQLGAAAQRRLGAPGPNMAGGGTNPTPPTMDPAQKPPAWQALQQAGIGGQGSAAANRAAAAGLPGFMPRPGGVQVMDGAPGTVAFPGGVQQGIGADPMTPQPFSGRPPSFNHGGQMLGVGNDETQAQGGAQQQQGGPSLGPVTNYGPANVDGHPGANPDAVAMMGGEGNIANALRGMQHAGGGPLPGFTVAPGVTDAARGVPLGSMPGPAGKFPPRPGLPTKPLPMPTPGTPQVRPGFGGGGLGPTGPRPRNNMASY